VGYFNPRDLAVRVKGDPLDYATALRQAVWSVDANQPIADVQPLSDLVAKELSVQRAQLWLLGAFAGLALLLAAIGLYGLLAHLVAQRTRDIGIRMALGASRAQVLRWILRQGLEPVAAGLASGTVGALLLTQSMRKLLYDVSPADPATLVLVALVLLLVAAVACYGPARRAATIDPMQALVR
jgi:ABC-type antimicrobial peptide transport system permease subunit